MSRMGQIKLAGWLSIPLCIAIIYVVQSHPLMFPYPGIWQIVIAGITLNTFIHLTITLPRWEKDSIANLEAREHKAYMNNEYSVGIVWGHDPDSYEEYSFSSAKEKFAFLDGVEEGCGYLSCEFIGDDYGCSTLEQYIEENE